MRVGLLAAAAVLIGVALGATLGYSKYGGLPAVAATPIDMATREAPKVGEPLVMVVNGETYQFGSMERNKTGSHEFIFKNEGRAPLTLKVGSTTCKCTIGALEKSSLEPGESTKVRLEWTPKDYSPEFSQTAEIHTNDSMRPTVELQISGTVIQTLRAIPQSVELGSVSMSEPKTMRIKLVDTVNEGLELASHSFTEKKTSKFFELRTEPFSAQDLEAEKEAKSGIWAVVSTKNGMPMGRLDQTLKLVFNHHKDPMELTINGQVTGDITLLGPRNVFYPEQNVLRLGLVKQSHGAEAKLLALLKGPHRENAGLSIAKVEPSDLLEVSLGEPEGAASGTILKQPVTVRIAKGARIGSYMGPSRNKAGKIVIATNHPDIKEIEIVTIFAVAE